jgi:hypothetical protein
MACLLPVRQLFVRRIAVRLIMTLVGLLVPAGMACAAENETREFDVFIDGKPAGSYAMSIVQRDDGSFVMSGKADVHCKFALVINYSYAYQGSELWKDGKLQKLDSTANDDGVKTWVQAVAEEEGLHIKSNSGDRVIKADVWTTTFWRLPEKVTRNQPVMLIDSDTGKEIAANLHYVDNQRIVVAGQNVTAAHYQVRGGGREDDLWYDGTGRLLRQESRESSHRYVLELARFQR